jgi:hypothetical protein
MFITNEILYKYAPDVVYASFEDDMKLIITLMISNNVSMIPIIPGGKKNLALIRRKTIWKYMVENQQEIPGLDEIKEEPLPAAKLGDALDDTLEKIRSNSAVLFADRDGVFRKILTPRSVSESLYDYSKRFVKINNLENKLKELINGLSIESVKACLTSAYNKRAEGEGVEKRVPDLDSLTMEDYKVIFNKLWDSFSSLQHLDKSSIIILLEKSRDYRNDVMHFRITGHDTEETNPCELMLKILPHT